MCNQLIYILIFQFATLLINFNAFDVFIKSFLQFHNCFSFTGYSLDAYTV